MFKQILAVITWPYRTAHDFVDVRPTASQLKTHLARLEPVTEKTDTGMVVSFVLAEETVPTNLTQLAQTEATLKDVSPMAAWAQGVEECWGVAQQKALNLTRSEFCADSALLRQVTREKQAQERAKSESSAVPASSPVLAPA